MIMITGGCGFIGSNFVLEWLRHTSEAIVNLDALTYAGHPGNLASVADHPRYRFVRGDICDHEVVRRVLRESRPHALVHFAAETHVDRSIASPDAFVRTNVGGTIAVLQAALAHQQTLPARQAETFRFVNISTDEVFGTLEPDEPAFTEHRRFAPNSPYAASKAAADLFVRAWHQTYGLPTITTNCSNNYGPRQFPEKLIPLVIHNALRGRQLPIYGDGLQVRDWLYVDDHNAAIRDVIQRGVPGQTYNIGGRSERTNLDVVRTVCATLDELRPAADKRPYAALIVHVDDRRGHDRRYAVDSGKTARDLGWKPAMPFEQGIRRTVAWYLENEDWVTSVTSGSYRQWVAQHYGPRT